MLVTELTRRTLASRRQARRLEALGYRRHETDWEIIRGLGRQDEVIIDVEISTCGKYVWTKLGKPTRPCIHKTLKAVMGEPFVGFYCTVCGDRWGFREDGQTESSGAK